MLLDEEAERKRYSLHENSLENAGYRAYLEAFLGSVLTFPSIVEAGFDYSWKVFDYGSGPEPALVTLMREKGLDARGWDPFFAKDTECFPGGADLVTCLEVAEHFKAPESDFARLSASVRIGGFAAIGTRLVDTLWSPGVGDQSPFRSWWYRQDPTHVSFYSKKALALLAAESGLVYLGEAGPHVFVFRKETAR
jgi:pseudouridine kinase